MYMIKLTGYDPRVSKFVARNRPLCPNIPVTYLRYVRHDLDHDVPAGLALGALVLLGDMPGDLLLAGHLDLVRPEVGGQVGHQPGGRGGQ